MYPTGLDSLLKNGRDAVLRFSGTSPVGRVWTCLIICTILHLCGLSQTAMAGEVGLRVQIMSGLSNVSLFFPTGGDLLDGRGRRIQGFRPGEKFQWSLEAEKSNEHQKKRKSPRRRFIGQTVQFKARNGLIEVNGAKYRGSLQCSFTDKGARIINLVGLEDYVKGVVGSEIGSLSPGESLKAQAVIARTYAFAGRGKHGSAGFDLCNREHCQVYGGVKAERPTVNGAVDATRGIIMISDGEPISSMYHSTCGGMTSNNEDVYGGKATRYLRRVKCDFCRSGNNYRWTRRIPTDVLKRRLAKENMLFQTVYSAKTEAPAQLDRVSAVVLKTDKGTISIKGTTFRRLFELPSTTFIAETESQLAGKPLARVPLARVPLAKGTREKPAAGKPAIFPFAPGPDKLVVITNKGVIRLPRPKTGWNLITSQEPSPVGKDRSPGSSPLLDVSRAEKIPLKQEAKAPLAKILRVLVLLGRGYGHQVGLCQAGAIDLGKRGWSYRQILPFYYSKVALRVLKP